MNISNEKGFSGIQEMRLRSLDVRQWMAVVLLFLFFFGTICKCGLCGKFWNELSC